MDKTPVSSNTWTTTSHAETSTALFAIYNIIKIGDADVGLTGVRHGDSTDAAQTTLTNTNVWAIVPLNVSFESGLYTNGGYDIFLVGFIDAGATVVEAPADKSTATTGSYQTVTPTSGTPEYIITQYRGVHTASANDNQFLLREPSAPDIWGNRPAGLHTTIVKADVSGNIEQQIAEIGNDLFVVGNITNAVAGATVDTVDDPDEFSGTLNYTHTGLGTITTATIDDGTNTISLTSITDSSGVIPDYGDVVNRLLTGTVTLTLGDGTLTATKTFTLNPKTLYSSVKLTSGFSTTSESYLYNYGGIPAIGDEFHYVTSEITLDNQGGWTTNGSGTTTIYGVDATDGVMESFTHETGAGSGGGSTITGTAITAVAITGSAI